MALSPGTKLGPYEIVAHIGAGGMGEVYRARDSRLNRQVAVKILPAGFASDAILAGRQKKRKRIEECFGWLKTVALMRKIRHRDVCKVRWS